MAVSRTHNTYEHVKKDRTRKITKKYRAAWPWPDINHTHDRHVGRAAQSVSWHEVSILGSSELLPRYL